MFQVLDAPGLENCVSDFWDMGASLERVTLRIAPPQVDMALLKRLRCPPFVDERCSWPQMERIYDGVTAQALLEAIS